MPPATSGSEGRGTTAVSGSQQATARSSTMAAPPVRTARAASATGHQLRHAPSTSSLRAKPVMGAPTRTASSNMQSSLQAAPQPHASLFSSLPTPAFPSPPLDSIEVTPKQIHTRLLQLARSYSALSDRSQYGQGVSTGDLDSACFYARLALNCDPSSISARRLLASTLLQGAQPLPFGPSSTHSTPLLPTSAVKVPYSSATRAGAHAAIEVLQNGPYEVFLDVGCARIFAAACTALGRTYEAEEALAWTLRESQNGDGGASSSEASFSKLPAFTTDEQVQRASVLAELARLSARSNRYDEARSHLSKARSLDGWSWSAWVGGCDAGTNEDAGTSFVAPRHDPRRFYATQLEQALLEYGYDKDAVHRAITEMTARGEDYFTALASSDSQTEGTATAEVNIVGPPSGGLTNRSQAPQGEEMMRTASKRTVAQAITPSSTISSLARPGSRSDVATAAKRMRTMPAQKANPAGARIGTAAVAKPKSESARPPTANLTGKNRPVPMTTTTASSVRTTGTLSASRTNEQARPASSASASSRGTANGDESIKASPRRSARVNVGGPGEDRQGLAAPARPQAQAQQVKQTRQPITSRRAIPARPAPRPVPPSSSSSSDAETAGSAKRVAPRTEIGAVPNKLSTVVQAAALGAAREAALWNVVDGEVMELVRTLAKAYQAVRNSRGRLALALLRPRGRLSSHEADELRKEVVLAASSSERSKLQNHPIQVYGGLATWHRNCVDVQCLMGRAQHDLGRYHLAEKHFLHARRLSPSLMAHMDIFSLTLFHLQREVGSSQLASSLTAIDPSSSITHVASGNTFALQREHNQALQCFQRACLAAPNYAYAFTLAGYEACEIGQREKSVQLFREAIRIEKRHWNAFAGLGQVYLQENNLQVAANYYGQALELHRNNAILWDVYGRVKMAQGSLGDSERAFECALRLDGSSAMSHIKLAEVLLRRASVERDDRLAAAHRDRAHAHLLKAVKVAPDEAHVHLMLARSYMDKGAGAFATLLHNSHRSRPGDDANEEDDGRPHEVSLSDLALVGSTGPGHLVTQQQQQIRAIGHATLPDQYRAEIARHLSTAVDLNPRLARYVRAMGEGARAALRGAAARLTGDLGDGSGFSASLLVDGTGMTTDGVVDSMLELDGEHVLEDPVSETEVMASDEGGDTREDTGGDGQESDGDGLQDAVRSGSDSQDVEVELEDDDDAMRGPLEADGEQHLSYEPARLRMTGRSRLGLGLSLPVRTTSEAYQDVSGGTRSSGTQDERDVSMSF